MKLCDYPDKAPAKQPVFTTSDFTVADCKARGMYAPPFGKPMKETGIIRKKRGRPKKKK